MFRIIIFLLTIYTFLYAEEDLTQVHHVNIITGHLELSFQDVELKSPVPFALLRTYSSAGALERTPEDVDLFLRDLKKSGWMFQGGWTFLPHTSLLMRAGKDKPKKYKAYVFEKQSGNLTPYSYHKTQKEAVYLRPDTKNYKTSGSLSAREDTSHNTLKVTKRWAILRLADGGERHYHGKRKIRQSFWRLQKEILPSKHRIIYHYPNKYSNRISKIEVKNPSETKTFASIDLDHSAFYTEKRLSGKPSDGSEFIYQMMNFKYRTYLETVSTTIRPKETMYYQPGRRGIGARVSAICFGNSDKRQFEIEYYLPPTKKKEKKWAKKQEPHVRGDKVFSIKMPDPETGEFVGVAQFHYFPEHTDVRDSDGLLTRYCHDGKKLQRVKYYDREQKLRSQTTLTWRNDKLARKRLQNSKGELLFSKTFSYDSEGNVIKEVWQGEKDTPPICRKFSYSSKRLLLSEEEVGGLSHKYEYLRNTDLLTKKLTLHGSKILLREFFTYNEDNLLVCTTRDDGNHPSEENLTGITERKIQTFTLDPATGLTQSITASYLDLNTLDEEEICKTLYTYNEKREVTSETLTTRSGSAATTRMEYDDSGRLIKRISPLGREETFSYDSLGNLLEAKEIGSPLKSFTYDFAQSKKSCTQLEKTTENRYDIKGRLHEYTDALGNTISQDYDCFGRCTKRHLPEMRDSQGNPYTPVITSTYDIQGNILSTTNPRGETTSRKYNILRKPTLVEHADKSTIRYEYNRDGTVSKTIYPDREIHYSYDPFQRMTTKIIRSLEGEILSEEIWNYNTLHLLSYTNPLGLTIQYTYDALGRKICESAQERSITYAYDDLGFLERITQGGASKTQKHNIEGEITEQWDEDSAGKIENHTYFFYDDEGRKEKALRITSQQEAQDHFFYDEEGHLSAHVDPLGKSTQFIYGQTTNSLGQNVKQTTIIDPLGNALVKTYDVGGHLVLLEKKDPQSQIVSKEHFFYDTAGNRAKRVVTIYEKNSPLRTYTHDWEYNERGWLIKEIEEGEKTTHFAYDTQGRLLEKTLPSKVTITQSYDALGRLLKLKSSDGSVHNAYSYDKGSQPIFAEDKIQGYRWERSYNLFGELTLEKRPDGSTMYWDYDNRGRCTKLTLPDNSSIQYQYGDLHLHSVTRYSSDGFAQYSHQYTQFDANGHVSQEELIYDLGTINTAHDPLERVIAQKTPHHSASIEYGPSGLVTKTENSLFTPKNYTYDPLNQLLQEGDTKHNFDSLGNPLDAIVNQYNQLIATALSSATYNENGNPFFADAAGKKIKYTYDALNRLTSIHYLQEKHIHYIYDPFFRLHSKETYLNQTSFFSYEQWSREVTYFLYDKEIEIGTLDEQNQIHQLKVQGLGILGDIGAAVAIELDSEVFAPLHDFQGNVIALIDTNGTLQDQCDIDAFGRVLLNSSSKNPWRFHSKRTEEHLVFFGARFYDLSMGRWLTPDPAGSIESPNLYIYALNCPLNRLDLFGLYSETSNIKIHSSSVESTLPHMHVSTFLDGVHTDLLIISNKFQELEYAPEKYKAQNIGLSRLLQDLTPTGGQGIGFGAYLNGICCSFEEFKQRSFFIAGQLPPEVPFVGIYTQTHGLVKDLGSTFLDIARCETPEAIATRQFLHVLGDSVLKVNENLSALLIPHSRGAAILNAALEGMDSGKREAFRENLLIIGIAPAIPLAREYAKEAINLYSETDIITGTMGRFYDAIEEDGKKKYDIRFLPTLKKVNLKIPFGYPDHVDLYSTPACLSFSLKMPEHGMMARTYQKAVEKNIRNFKNKYGFCKETR